MSTAKMKKINSLNVFKGVINNLRETVSNSSGSGVPDRLEAEIMEKIHPPHLSLERTLVHGYPYKPTAMAFDPVQKVLAIGNKGGCIRLLGKPGIDLTFQHDHKCEVKKLVWVVNKGQLLSMCGDDCIYLLDIKQGREIEIVQMIKFNKEIPTSINLAVNSSWVFVGTNRGNTHVLRLDNFSLSAYVINWNKAIGVTLSSHPGAVNHIVENPADPSKLLIGFASGTIALWDLSTRKQEEMYQCPKKFTSLCWHYEGKQFVCSCTDGSLVTWNIKPVGKKPASVVYPHREKGSDISEPLSPIDKVEWMTARDGDSVLVFSGGLPQDVTGAQPAITVMQGKQAHTTVLEMEFCVLDFVTITDSPYRSEQTDPQSILVLLTNDLVAIDCKSTGLPSFENPYAMDLQESAVTCCAYVSDCPGEMIVSLYNMGTRVKKSQERWSTREWPVSGGADWTKQATRHHELLVTGHCDGSVRFWDVTSTNMQHLYRLRTQKLFEKNKEKCSAGVTIEIDDDPYAITNIAFSSDTKVLVVTGHTDQVVLYTFSKKDVLSEIACLEIPIIYEVSLDKNENSPNFDFHARPPLSVASQSSSYNEPAEGFTFEKRTIEYYTPLKVRAGQIKKPSGYQADLVCLTPWVNGEAPSQITCLTVNSNFGLLSYGNGSGLVIVDYIQHKCLLNMGTADLYGSNDPFQRMPKSPKPLGNSPNVEDFITKVDLSNYNQMNTEVKSEDGQEKVEAEGNLTPVTSSQVARVKSPAAKSLSNKAGTGSSAEENSSLSKSRSSSVNSLDQVVEGEGVTAVMFGDSFPSKNEFDISKCLYIGTSLGSVLVIVIVVPDSEESRESDNVIVSPSGFLLRLKSAILEFSLLDTSLHLEERSVPLENLRKTVRSKQNVSESSQTEPGASPAPQGDQIILVVSAEKGATCHSLPSQKQIHNYNVPDVFTLTRCQTISWLGEERANTLLMCLTSDGRIKVLSLPTFRQLLEVPLANDGADIERVQRTVQFSTGGLGTYFSNQNQVQKFSINKEETKMLFESFGKLYQEKVEMPDPPKQSFFKGFFGGGVKQLDRDELFGEGKASSTVAQVTQGDAIKGLTANSISGESEIFKAKMLAMERGKKLNEVEDKTEQLSNDAKIWADSSRQLRDKYKNQKWYQF